MANVLELDYNFKPDCGSDGKCLELDYVSDDDSDFTWDSDGSSDLNFDDTSQLDEYTQYFPNSLKYLTCSYYLFLYLLKTFQANNLVGLEMINSEMKQLWEEGDKKVLKKLRFLDLWNSKLTTFDFRIIPNLETLSLKGSNHLVELCMPVTCQKLKNLVITDSKLRTFDLGLTPNLETLTLDECGDFKELHVFVTCPNLKSLNLSNSSLMSLDLDLIPNLEMLELNNCVELVEIILPVESVKKVVELHLNRYALFEKLPEDLGQYNLDV